MAFRGTRCHAGALHGRARAQGRCLGCRRGDGACCPARGPDQLGAAPAAPPGFASAGHPVAAPASADQFAIQVLDLAPVPPGAQPWTAAPPAVLNGWMSVAVSGLVDLDALYLVNDPGLTGLLETGWRSTCPAAPRSRDTANSAAPAGMRRDSRCCSDLRAQRVPGPAPIRDHRGRRGSLRPPHRRTGGLGNPIAREASESLSRRRGADRLHDPLAANPSSGPVSVQLGEAAGARARRRRQCASPCARDRVCGGIAALPPSPSSLPPSAPTPPTRSRRDSCGSTVSVSESTGQLPALRDSGCSLRRLVASLLPPPAVGTRGSVAYCQPG